MSYYIQQQSQGLRGVRRPIIRRVIIILIVFLVSFIILATIGITSSLELRLTSESQATLNQVQDTLLAQLEQYEHDIQLIAASNNLQNFILSNQSTDRVGRDLLSVASTLITLNNNEYQAVRYISMEGTPHIVLEVINKSRVPVFTSDEELPMVAATRQIADPVFQALASGAVSGTRFSDMYLIENDDTDDIIPVISLYQPVVYQSSELAGILELQINLQQFLSVIDEAENNLFPALAGRRLLLINKDYRLLADSSAQTAYLSRISADIPSTVSDYAFIIDELEQNTAPTWQTRDFTYRIIGQEIVIDETSAVWHIVYIDEFLSVYRPAILGLISTILLSILLGIAAYAILTRQIVRVLRPVYLATGLIQQLATATGVIPDPEAPETLENLEQSSRNIEKRIHELARTIEVEQIQRRRDLQLVRRIGQAFNQSPTSDQLLDHVVKVIGTEMNVNHVSIYRLDESRTQGKPVAGYHQDGQSVNQPVIRQDANTLVGTVFRRRSPVINPDTSQSPYDDNNRHMPETRSELGLPLIIEGTSPGALILQSSDTTTFTEDNLPVYQLIADQLASVISHHERQEQVNRRLEQARRLNEQLTANVWSETGEHDQLESEYGILPENGSMTAPITVRGQVIGSLDAALPDNRDLTAGDKVVLSAVAERVSLAVENARLFQETQHSLAETSTLYQLSRELTETTSLEDILRVIIISVAPDATSGQIWLFDDYLPGDTPDIVRLVIDLPVNDRNYNLQDIMLRVGAEPLLNKLQPDRILPISDIAAADNSGDGQLPELFGMLDVSAIMIFPLNIRSRWKGFVSIDFATPRQFSESEERIYNTLIGQAGVAIDNRLLIEQTENALSRNEKLYAASRIINTAAGLDDLVYAALSTTNDRMLSFWLALLEGTENERGWATQARVVARSERDTVNTAEIIYELPLTEHSPMYDREPEIIVDPGYELADVSVPVAWMRSMNLQFMMIFPLFSENTPIALFYIVSEAPYVITSEEYEVYSALTGQMSTRIQSQRFLESTRKALSDVQRLYAATRALTTTTETEDLYEAVAGHLAHPFLQEQNPDLEISITLLQAGPRPQTNALYLEYLYEWHNLPDIAPLFETDTRLSHEAYPFGELSENFEENLFIYQDIAAEVNHSGLQKILQGHNAQSAIVAPLQYRQSWYGVLICRINQQQLFDESYMDFVQAIASQVAIAFERQELLAENDRERRNLNDILSTLSAGVLVLDPNTLIPVQANDAASELLGQSIDYNHPFTAAHYDIYRTGTNLHYPDQELPIMLARQLNRAVPGDDLAVILDNYHIDLQISAAPIYDDAGKIKSIVAAFLDISNLRGLENTLQEQLRESVSLYEALRSLSQSDSLDELLDNILLQLTLQQPDDAYILIVDEQGKNLRVERELVQAIQPIAQLSPLLIDEHENYVPDIHLEVGISEPLLSVLSDANIRSIITLPMFARSLQVPIGWLVLCSRHPHDFSPEQERTLVSISDMASTAIDNRYLMEQTEVALDETAALYDASTGISRASDLDELSIALQRSLAGLQPDMYAAYLTLDEDGDAVAELFSIGFEDSIAAGMDINTVVTGRMSSGDTLYVADVTRSTLGAIEREVINAGNIMSFAAVNMRLKDVRGGRLFIGYKTPRKFSKSDERFLTAIAGSASVVINNEILLGQVQTALQETSILYQASRALIEVSTPEEIMEAITTHLVEPHINQVYIMMLNGNSWHHPSASVDIVSSWQQDSDIDLLHVTLTPEQFPAWTQLSSPDVLTIHDIYDETLNIDLLEQTSIESLDTRSLVVIPLRVVNRSIGAIWMGSREEHRYPDDRLRIFQAFSEQSSLSLEATRLLKQTEQRAAQLETSAVISQSIGQILDLDILLPQVVDLIRAQFKYDQVQIFLMDRENNRAVLRASTGESGLQLLAINHSLPIGSKSVIGQVTATGKSSVALDTADASVIHKPNPYLPLTRSEMAMPLLAKNEIVGALDVQSNEPDAFTEEDIQALTALAAQISVAIDNARLYEDAQRQAMDMNFLFEMTALVASMESVSDALALIAERVEDNLNALSVAMYLPQVYADYMDNTITRMRLVTLTGQTNAYPSDFDEIDIGDGDSIIGIVSKTLQAYHVINVAEDPLYTPFVRTARSAYIAPVTSGNNIISLITIESSRSDAFDTGVQKLVRTLASSMAAVIQSILLVEQLQESNEQLREVDRLKSQFLAAMSHELRTPLNSIIGFSRVMLKGIDGPLTEMQEQDLTTIYDSGNHLLNLVNDILDQAKIRENQLTLKTDYFEMKPLIEGVKSIAIGYMKQKSVPLDLIVELAPNLPPAYGNEFRSRQIVMNLVTNAIKFTSDGAVTIRVYLDVYDDREYIRVDVIDTGIGIAEDDLSILFEEFRQVDNSLTRNAEGTGLGLPISKALAELQGGMLLVESEVNVGSIFSAMILTEPGEESVEEDDSPQPTQIIEDRSRITGEIEPVFESDTQIVKSETRKMRPPNRRTTRSMMPVKREVLLVEDQKEMVDQYRRTLQKEGFEVQTADMPAYARAMVGTLRPTLVILDVDYADGEGWNVLKDLKEQDATFDIPIIVSTANTDSEQVYQLGANYYLHRPVMPEDLMETVLMAETESRRERILIIDDEPAAIRLLSQVLGEYGNYRIFSAKNGVEGISMVARRRPDLVILDLRMPEMDGFAVLEELYNNPETANIPVMVVTGDIDFNADEQEQLQHIHVLPKTHISQEEYDQFLADVRNHLNPGD